MKRYNFKLHEGIIRNKLMIEEKIETSWRKIEKAILSMEMKKARKTKNRKKR